MTMASRQQERCKQLNNGYSIDLRDRSPRVKEFSSYAIHQSLASYVTTYRTTRASLKDARWKHNSEQDNGDGELEWWKMVQLLADQRRDRTRLVRNDCFVLKSSLNVETTDTSGETPVARKDIGVAVVFVVVPRWSSDGNWDRAVLRERPRQHCTRTSDNLYSSQQIEDTFHVSDS